MFKKDWKKEIKKLLSQKGTDALKMEVSPYRDWLVVANLFFVAVVASVGFNTYMSVNINDDTFFQNIQKDEKEITIDKVGLQKILTEFSGKEGTFEKVASEKTPMVDPSL